MVVAWVLWQTLFLLLGREVYMDVLEEMRMTYWRHGLTEDETREREDVSLV